VICFTALNRLISVVITNEETNINPDIIFADLSTNQYFLEYHADMHWIHNSLATLARYRSEESIRAGEHLIWVEHYNVIWLDDYSPWDYGYYEYDQPIDADRNIYENSDSAQTVPNMEIDRFLYEFRERFFMSSIDWDINTEHPEEFYIIERWLQLHSLDRAYLYASVPLTDIATADDLYIHEANAIRAQLQMFQNAQNHLNQVEGLLYYIGIETTPMDGSDESLTVFSNVHAEQQYAEFFKSFPVYTVMSWSDFGTFTITQTDNTSTPFRDIRYDLTGDVEMFLAFTSQVVDVQNQVFSAARNVYIRDFTIVAVSAVLVLGLIIVLMVAAGRKYSVVEGESTETSIQTSKVHFIPIDKIYLDIGLTLLAGWVALVFIFTVRIFYSITHHMNVTALNLFALSVMLLTVPFLLVWLTSLAKRIRAGKFWKHTLVYAIVYSCIFGSIRFIFRSAKALWAGTRLTFKVAVISCAAFFTMLFIGSIGTAFWSPIPIFFISLPPTAVITVLLLMYARRIRKLEQGARDATQGKYYPPIEAGGGELGSIANSINNISAGINTAVEERMKSERLKTELITNVSHDIRTPLTSIITYTDLLEHEGLDCEKAPEYLEILKQKSLRLKTLTEELFEAAKASTGNIDVNLADLNIVSLIDQVLGELDNAVKSSGLDLRVNLPDKLLAVADGRLMQRVMENLLSNVFKYSLPGSRVYLDAVQTDALHVRLELKNISSQELNFDPSELTERFKRGDDSRADGGSGLGLSIVQSFMDAQGGSFHVSIDGDLFKATIFLPAVVVVSQESEQN